MRSRKLLVGALLALPLLAGVTACGGEGQEAAQQATEKLDQAEQGVDSTSTCAEAMGITSFTPSFSDPEQARAEAEAKLEEISALAEQTSDPTLRENLSAVQQSLEQVASGEVTVENSVDWISEHVDKTSEVALTCGRMVE